MQTKQRLDVPLSLKSVSDSGEFEGYGSVFGVKDSHDDVVMSGAFAASLRAWSDRKALPALLWQHRMDEPIGVYTEMKEDDVGLYVRGRLLIDDDPLAKRAHAHMKAGSLYHQAHRRDAGRFAGHQTAEDCSGVITQGRGTAPPVLTGEES